MKRRSVLKLAVVVLAACTPSGVTVVDHGADPSPPSRAPTDAARPATTPTAASPATTTPDAASANAETAPKSAAAPAEATPTTVAGLPVLRLSGTPHEMGFQHGKALAAGIKEGITEFCVKYRSHGIRARYEQIRKRVANEVEYPAEITDELEGMLEGMEASGVDLTIPLLKRKLDLLDLQCLNSVDHWGLFGCSGITAWGACTPDGEVLTSRNFDFDADPEAHAIVRLGIVLVFHPKEGRPFASFAFPGLVGVTTGVNDAGVACFLHVANGTFGGGEIGESIPLLVIARELMQRCDGAHAAPLARERLAKANVRNSFLFRVVTRGDDAPPTSVFEIDSLGFGEQKLPDVAAGEKPLLVATNHYRTRNGVFDPIPDSKIRFSNLTEGAQRCLLNGDHVIAPEEAFADLEKVAQDGGIVTLHSLVFVPRSLDLWASFSRISEKSGRPISAPHAKPARVNLRELLGGN